MSLSSHVNVQITIESGALKLPGFGRALILATPGAQPSTFTDRRAIYTEASDMLADGWLSSDEEYLMARSVFSQRPRPKDVMVGRRNAAVAQVTTITVSAGTDGTYTVSLNGTTFTHVASGETAAQIMTALRTLIAAGADVTGGLVTQTGSTPSSILTSAVAGVPMVISVTGPAIAAVVTTPNHGIPEDLQLITDVDPDWYIALIPETDRSTIVRALAPTIEAQNREAVVRSAQSAIVSAAYNPAAITADIASELKGLNFLRTSLWYHDAASSNFLDAAVVGRMLPTIPGSATWKFKQLAGVATVVLTATQRANLLSKNANSYETIGGKSYTFDGTEANGEWIDIVRGIDNLYSRIQALIFSAQLQNDKIDYTQQGLRLLGGLVEAALSESVRSKFIAGSRTLPDGTIESPAFSVTVPTISDIPSATRETREVPSDNPIRFEATLAGAIHVVNVVGTVSF